MRQAILLVSRQLLEEIMPDWRTCADVLWEKTPDLDAIAVPYHAALKLPDNCRIVGIGTWDTFDQNPVAFRVESPDFVEIPDGYAVPEVAALYKDGRFFAWTGKLPDDKTDTANH